MNPYRLHAYGLLLIVALIWGIAGPVIKYTLGAIPALPFLAYRFGLSAAVAIILMLITGLRLPKNVNLGQLLLYSFLTSTVSLGLLFLGLERTTVLDATLISAVSPLLVAIAGVIYLKEHVTGREKLGMGIAFLGTLLIIIEPLFKGEFDLTSLKGNFFVLLYLLASTWATVLAKKLIRKGAHEITLTNYSFVVGFVTTLPLILIFYGLSPFVQSVQGLELSYHAGVWFMALVSGTLAYTLWAKAQKTIEIGEAGLFAYLTPIFAAPLAIIWLKEEISPTFIVAAIIITVGVLLAELKPSRKS
jgi:drug/metabolite transporter (DMT)-like permease